MRNLTGFLQDPSYILLPGGAAAQQQYRGEKQGQYASIHRVSSFQGNQDSLRPFERHGQCSGAQQALFLNLGSAHIGGERLLDELLQRLRLLLFCDGSYDGFTHDIAAAVDHIGGGISKDVGSKLSRLTI